MVRRSCVSHDRCFLKPTWQSVIMLLKVGYDAAVDDVLQDLAGNGRKRDRPVVGRI